MKTRFFVCLLVLLLGTNSAIADAIVEDNFNSYANGSVVGQGGWESYDALGYQFIVQDSTALEGAKALYCNSLADNVIGKQGDLLADGRQVIYVRSENRDYWSSDIGDGNAQIRMNKGLWSSPGGGQIQSFTALSFKKDGNVAYYNQSADVYQNFATYSDKVWTLVEVEWRSSDTSARYRIDEDIWTDWNPIAYSSVFSGFDYVGLAFDNRGGSGGVYFAALGVDPVPEPATIVLLVTGLIAGGFLFRRK